MALTLANHILELERILLLFLRLAFKRRAAPVADLATLAATSIEVTNEGDLRYVTDQDRVYVYSEFSGAAHAPPAVVLPTGSTKPGRWLRVSVPWNYGPNSNRPLQARTPEAWWSHGEESMPLEPAREPVERALITHGHSDHARAGHGAVLATQEMDPETLIKQADQALYLAKQSGRNRYRIFTAPPGQDATVV